MKIKIENPYKVPPFRYTLKRERMKTYIWYSWHPLYPYWSKSCWGGATKAAAIKDIKRPEASGMFVYHNKLIKEMENGRLIEVFDMPCQRLDVWQKIFEAGKGPINHFVIQQRKEASKPWMAGK